MTKEQKTPQVLTVQEAIWPWNRPAGGGAADAGRAVVRRALGRAVVMAVIAAVFFLLRLSVIGWIISAAAVVMLGLARFAPSVYGKVECIFARLGGWVGAALTWIFMTAFFYICFLPAGLLLRALRKDPMRLKFPARDNTCWQPHAGEAGPDSYKHLY